MIRKVLFSLTFYILFVIGAVSQTIYITSSGGSFTTEKWLSVSTGANDSGTQVWRQNNAAIPCGTTNGGLVNDVAIDVSSFCGQTLYVNAYDRWADGWDGTTYEIWTGPGQTGTLLANNSGASPNDGSDSDASSSFCDLASQELEVSESFVAPACPCTDPAAGYTIVKDCGNGQFSIDVNVTSLGDASGVDITDGTTTFQTNVGTGTYTVGPFSAGANKIIQVNGSGYGGCDIVSGTLTEACECITAPVATVTSGNLNCGASTYDINVTVTSDGSGDVNKTDIKIDGVVVQTDATTGNLYTFSVAEGSHTVTLEAEGTGFVTCTSTDYDESQSCNNDECNDAFTVNTDGTPVSSLNTNTYTSSGTNLSCDGGGGTEDAWYKFVAPVSGMVLIDVEDSGLSGTISNLMEGALYASCGGAEVACFGWNNSNYLGSYDAASSRGRVVSGLTPGSTYYLELEHYSNDWSGVYTVTIRDLAPEISANNQVCLNLTDAISLYDVGSFGEEFNCSMFGSPEFTGSDEEEYLLYRPSSNETVNIIASSASFDDADGIYIGLFEWNPGVSEQCLGSTAGMVIDGVSTSGEINNISLTGGNTYVIVVGEDYNDAVSVCVEIQVQCGSTSSMNTITNDCAAQTFTGRLNFSALSGGVTYSIEDDLGTTYNNISTGINYDFNYTDLLNHSVTLNGYDGGANLVCSSTIGEFTSNCNGTETCASAPDLTNTCLPGDLTSAVNEGVLSANPSCGNGTSVRTCSAGFSPSSNYEDIWYSVDNSLGANSFTVNITDLTGSEEVIVFLYDGGCADGNLMDHFYQNPVTTSVTAPAGSPGGDCAVFNSSNSSFEFHNVSAVSTIYLRVMPHVNASNCTGLVNADFTICTTVPQPNDIDDNAIEIDGTSSTGNLCAAAVDAETSETGDACADSQDANDLWYKVTPGASDPDAFLEVTLDFTNASDAVVVSLYSGAYANGWEECQTFTSTGPGSSITQTFNTELILTSSYYLRVTPVSGNSICDFTISANRVVENNTCSHFTNVLPGYNLHNGSHALNFNYVTPSGKDGIAGKDMWFTIDHNANQSITISTSSQTPDWDGTAAIYLYEYNSPLTLDCDNLVMYCSQTGLDDFDLESGVTFNLGTGDYLLRIVETAVDLGGDQIDVTISGTSSVETILSNSSCANALDISSGSQTGNFSQAQLACPQATITCGATSYNSTPFDDYYGAALWYQFTMPGTACSGGAPLVSSEIRSVEIAFSGLATNSGAGNKQAYVELYSDCNTLLECGQTVDNATNAFFENLTIGDTYFIRVINNTLASTSTSDFTVEAIMPGDPAPCNDFTSDSYTLPVLTDLDVDNLPIYSADGATVSDITYDDVWFDFIAPAQNGDNYPLATANLSFVTIYAENVSGDLLQFYVWDTVTAGEDNVTIANRISPSPANQNQTLSGVGDYTFFQVGHLVPGEKYYIQVLYNSPAKNGLTQKAGNNERFKLAVLQPGEDNNSLCSSGSTLKPIGVTGCRGDCQAIYKIEVDVTGNYQIEATGDSVSVVLNVYQNDTEMGGEQSEGYPFDQDHPCQWDQHLQDITARLVSSTTIPSDEHGCYPNFTGERNVYNLTRSESSNRIYYYVEVIDQSSGGALHGCRGPEICELRMYAVGSSTTLYTGECKTYNVALPVELISLNAYNANDDNVVLWSTASEINNSYFDVEHSLDGFHFEVIGKVNGQGNSSTLTNYEFTHSNVQSGKHYYRLMQVDFDGNRTYTEVVTVDKSENEVISLVPNPNNGEFYVSFSKNVEGELIIRNALGQRVFNQQISGKKFNINLNDQSKGVYFVTFTSQHFQETVRLILD